MESLWPKLNVKNLNIPKDILQTQASFLERDTLGVLQAEVKTYSIDTCEAFTHLPDKSNVLSDQNKIVCHSLIVKAPFLGQYQFELLALKHYLFYAYPIEINDNLTGAYEVVKEEEELIRCLTGIFKSKETISVLQSLLMQSK